MTRNRLNIFGIGIACISILLAIAVYMFLRADLPVLLEPFQSNHKLSLANAALSGSAPSLFYTLAIGVLLGTIAPNPAAARFHCLGWTVIALLLEFTQHALFARPVIAALTNYLSDSALHIVGPYWSRGVFDPLDLLATLIGGLLALTIVSRLTTGASHVDDQ